MSLSSRARPFCSSTSTPRTSVSALRRSKRRTTPSWPSCCWPLFPQNFHGKRPLPCWKTGALLERCGFETEDFGGGDVLIRQIPSDVDVEDAKALLQELAGDLLAGKTLDPDSLRDNLLHTIACKSAIKAGWADV